MVIGAQLSLVKEKFDSLRVWKFCLHEILLTVMLHNALLNAAFNGAKEAISFMVE